MTCTVRNREKPASAGSHVAESSRVSAGLFTRAAGLGLAMLSLLGACVADPGLGPQPGEQAIWARDLLAHVGILASPRMEGRAAGSEGAGKAAEYIAGEFRKIGLRPGGTGDTFFQAFDLVTEIRLGSDNRLESVTQGANPVSREFRPWAEFIPISFSEEGTVEAEITFVGYGITAPELGYDDYAGIDVAGKAVLIMTHEPRERDQHGPFRSAEAFHYTTNRYKAINAREHGAAAILLVTDPNNHSGEQDTVLSLQDAPSSSSGIVAVSIVREVAETLITGSRKTLSGLQQEIDGRLAPRSFLAEGIKVNMKVSLVRARGTTANVVGLLPGRDPVLKDEAVVIGAHYDHLGRGGESSLAPGAFNAVHPGADDNASGTSALMALASAFRSGGGTGRTLIFVAFSGEEIGLLGSYHYVKHPSIPIERTIAMINLDSVGRMDKHLLYIQGVGSGEGLREIVQEANRGLGVDLTLRDDGFGPSDHTPFYAKERPVLHFFTGPHLDYHRPSDTIDKINVEGLHTVTTLAYRTVAMIADRATPIAYRKTGGTPPSERSGERGVGYGPYFGSIPDFSESAVAGVLLSGVRPGSPAERAGLQAGDVIVNFAGIAVKNLQDLIFALRTKRAGDGIDITFLRRGKEVRTQATLERRR